MKKIILYVTDLYNTFFSNECMYLRDLEMKKLVLNLEKLRILHHSDIVFFEFVTTINKEVLNIFLKEFNFYIKNSSIFYGNHLCDDGIFSFNNNRLLFEEKKVDKLQFLNKEIEKYAQNYEIEAIYYVDDSLYYQEKLLKENNDCIDMIIPCMISEIDSRFWTSKLSSLEGVNECLNKKIKSLIKKQF